MTTCYSVLWVGSGNYSRVFEKCSRPAPCSIASQRLLMARVVGRVYSGLYNRTVGTTPPLNYSSVKITSDVGAVKHKAKVSNMGDVTVVT